MLHEELMFLFLPALRPFLDSISYICMSKNNSPNFLHGEHYEKNREAGGRRAFILSGFGYLPQLPCDPLFTVVEILTNVPALFTFYYWSTLHPYCLWESPPHEIPLVPKSILIPLPAVCILDPTLTRGELQLLSFLNLKGLPASLHTCSAVPCPEITTL